MHLWGRGPAKNSQIINYGYVARGTDPEGRGRPFRNYTVPQHIAEGDELMPELDSR